MTRLCRVAYTMTDPELTRHSIVCRMYSVWLRQRDSYSVRKSSRTCSRAVSVDVAVDTRHKTKLGVHEALRVAETGLLEL
jgi:hypothetical protein